MEYEETIKNRYQLGIMIFPPKSIFVFIITVLVFISFSNVYADSNEYTIGIAIQRIEYEHLGNEISYSYSYNGQSLSDGGRISVSGSSFIISVTITEEDSIPDSNSGEFSFTNNGKSQSINKKITVHERGGTRYPGAYAVWDVTVTATPVSTAVNTTPLPWTSPSSNQTSSPSTQAPSSSTGVVSNATGAVHFSPMMGFGGAAALLYILTKVKRTRSINGITKQYNTSKATPTSITTSSPQPPRKSTITKPINSSDTIRCPKCGCVMVKRHGRYGYFYGCSNYPRCHGTRSINRPQ